MKVQYISSACVLVEHQNVKILCDPWLTDGIYYGSWFHYPPLQYQPEDFSDMDYIYISHIHPDHMDMETLKRLPKTIPILIHEFAEKYILRNLQRLGFETIREVAHRELISLHEDFTMEILAADNCDPQICGKFMGCSILTPYERTIQLDSLAVFHGGGKTVVNTNDCPYDLAFTVCKEIRTRYGNIDFLLVGYSGAGPFPQCFELDEPHLIEKGLAKKEQFLTKGFQYLKSLNPRYFMPFAGQYHLGGKLHVLNDYRGVLELEELPELFARKLASLDLQSELVLLDSGEWFDVDLGAASKPFTPPDPVERKRYIQEALASKKYSYELDEINTEQPEQVLSKLLEAQQRMIRYQNKEGNYRTNWSIYLDVGQPVLFRVPFDGSLVSIAEREKEIEPFVRISLHPALFDRILNRKAHWNNAEIGSHLHYVRRPDHFERGIYHFLSYLHQ